MKTWGTMMAAVVVFAAGQAWGLQLQFEGMFKPTIRDIGWIMENGTYPILEETDNRTQLTFTVDDYSFDDRLCDSIDRCTSYRNYLMHIADFEARTDGTESGHVAWRMEPFPPGMTWYNGGDYVPGTMQLQVVQRMRNGNSYLTMALFNATVYIFAQIYNETNELLWEGTLPSFFGVDVYLQDGFFGANLVDVPNLPVLQSKSSVFDFPLGLIYVGNMKVVHDDLDPGDADADADFDQLDLVQVAQGGKYLTGQLAPWSQGDWNADGVFDQLDLVAAQTTSVYQTGLQAARAVPEPASVVFLLVALTVLSIRTFRYLV